LKKTGKEEQGQTTEEGTRSFGESARVKGETDLKKKKRRGEEVRCTKNK